MTDVEKPEMPTYEVAFDMYRQLVEGYDQAIPMVMYGSPEPVIFALAQMVNDNLQDTLMFTCNLAARQFGTPDWIVVSNEAWGLLTDAEGLQNYQPGDAATSPDRVDMVAICAVGKDTAWQATTPFRRTSEGVEWGEPMHNDIVISGGVPDILRAAIEGTI